MKSARHTESAVFHNLLHTLAILAAMGGLFGMLGWIIFGLEGLLMSLSLAILLLLSTPKITPPIILKMYGARPLGLDEAPTLYAIVSEFSRRADLPAAPVLYYVPSPVMNAFSVGSRQNSAIALSDRLIRFLSLRELAGVLAHEMGHIRNNDLRLHAFADMMTRITSLLSFLGQVLILLYLPVMFVSKMRIPIFFIAILIFAPTLSMLLQLALSRSREFAADSTAVSLSNDPEGLASALEKMDSSDRKFWDILVLPGRRMPDPSLLRTHPNTGERVQRIRLLEGGHAFPGPDDGLILPDHINAVKHAPRWSPPRPWR